MCHAIIESKLDPEVDVLPVDGALKVTVRLFAGYRQAAGTASVPLELAEGATVGGLAEQVVRLYPAIGTDPSKLVVAVNQEYADHDLSLKDGDEVALIPPVSGGFLAGRPTTRNYGIGRQKARGESNTLVERPKK